MRFNHREIDREASDGIRSWKWTGFAQRNWLGDGIWSLEWTGLALWNVQKGMELRLWNRWDSVDETDGKWRDSVSFTNGRGSAKESQRKVIKIFLENGRDPAWKVYREGYDQDQRIFGILPKKWTGSDRVQSLKWVAVGSGNGRKRDGIQSWKWTSCENGRATRISAHGGRGGPYIAGVCVKIILWSEWRTPTKKAKTRAFQGFFIFRFTIF